MTPPKPDSQNEFRRMEKWGLAIASTGLLLVSVFHFYNAYFYYSELPAGLFFLMPGMLFSLIGLLSYVIAAFRSKVIPKWVLWIPTVLCALMIIWPFASALIYQYYGNEVSTRYGAITQVLTGLTWAALGVKLFIEKQNHNKQSVTQKALN